MITIKRSWKSQKPPTSSTINWGHPLSKGLVGCWLMNEGGGLKVGELTSSQNGVLTNATWSRTIKGISTRYANNQTDLIRCTNKSVYNLQGAFTIVMLGYLTSFGTTQYENIICAKDHEGNGQRTFRYAIAGTNDTGNIGKMRFIYNIGTNTSVYSSSIISLNKWYSIALTSNQTKYNYYLNGVSAGTANTNITPQTSGAANYTIAFVDNVLVEIFVKSWNGDIAYVYIYNRALLPSEISQLYYDPYCFIQPQRKVLFFGAEGVIPPTGVPRRGFMRLGKYW
jgi:hypothetical protein